MTSLSKPELSAAMRKDSDTSTRNYYLTFQLVFLFLFVCFSFPPKHFHMSSSCPKQWHVLFLSVFQIQSCVLLLDLLCHKREREISGLCRLNSVQHFTVCLTSCWTCRSDQSERLAALLNISTCENFLSPLDILVDRNRGFLKTPLCVWCFEHLHAVFFWHV